MSGDRSVITMLESPPTVGKHDWVSWLGFRSPRAKKRFQCRRCGRIATERDINRVVNPKCWGRSA